MINGLVQSGPAHSELTWSTVRHAAGSMKNGVRSTASDITVHAMTIAQPTTACYSLTILLQRFTSPHSSAWWRLAAGRAVVWKLARQTRRLPRTFPKDNVLAVKPAGRHHCEEELAAATASQVALMQARAPKRLHQDPQADPHLPLVFLPAFAIDNTPTQSASLRDSDLSILRSSECQCGCIRRATKGLISNIR